MPTAKPNAKPVDPAVPDVDPPEAPEPSDPMVPDVDPPEATSIPT